jgi:hypothetical protein
MRAGLVKPQPGAEKKIAKGSQSKIGGAWR